MYVCVYVDESTGQAGSSRFDFLLISPAAAVSARYSDSNDNSNSAQKWGERTTAQARLVAVDATGREGGKEDNASTTCQRAMEV